MMKLLTFVVLIAIAVSVVGRSADVEGQSFQFKIIDNVLRTAPQHARLINFRSAGAITDEQLWSSLIDNATTIRENIVGGFDCQGKIYGYYADPLNDCQIFHICVPLKQLFPKNYEDTDVMHFSFICPKYTIFSQAEMVCAWERSAIPCSLAPDLYHLNSNFFLIPSNETDVAKVSDLNEKI